MLDACVSLLVFPIPIAHAHRLPSLVMLFCRGRFFSSFPLSAVLLLLLLLLRCATGWAWGQLLSAES